MSQYRQKSELKTYNFTWHAMWGRALCWDVGNVLGNAACLETWFPSSSSRKWLKNSGWHDHEENQYQWQSVHLGASYTGALKVELRGAFQSYMARRKQDCWLANLSFSMDSFSIHVMDTPPSEVSSLLFDDISEASMPRNIHVTLSSFITKKKTYNFTWHAINQTQFLYTILFF